MLISAQVPAGTCRLLERKYPGRQFAYSPENLRLGKAIEIFLHQDRIVLGTRQDGDVGKRLADLLSNFSSNLLQVRTESAEMIKHGINSFLALSITFMNEIARICEHVGADAREVERGLKVGNADRSEGLSVPWRSVCRRNARQRRRHVEPLGESVW